MQTNLYKIFKPINLILLVNFILVISSPSFLYIMIILQIFINICTKQLHKKVNGFIRKLPKVEKREKKGGSLRMRMTEWDHKKNFINISTKVRYDNNELVSCDPNG